MGLREIAVWLALSAIGLQASSMAVASVSQSETLEESPEVSRPPPIVIYTPSPTVTATPIPTFTPTSIPTLTPTPSPVLTPNPTQTFTPSPTLIFTPTPTFTVTPTPTPIPSPTPPFVCAKIHGRMIGEHIGWAMQGRLCIGRR